MRLKTINIILSVILSAIFVGAVIAQPRCNPSFNPFEGCNYSPNDQHIFFGRVVSIENIDNKFIPNSKRKVIVEIERAFKGNTQRRIEVFLDYSKCGYDPIYKDNDYIFTAKEISLEGSSIMFSDKWSFSMNDYTERDRNEIFSVITSRLKNIKVTTIAGTVILSNEMESPAGGSIDKTTLKLGYLNRDFNPMAGTAVEAKREEDEKVFQTVTDTNGNYTFEDLADGTYKVYPILPRGYYKAVEYAVIGAANCQSKIVFRINKVANLSGRIELPVEEVTSNSMLIISTLNDKGKIVDTLQAVRLSDAVKTRIGSQYVFSFYFPIPKSGKYFLELRFLREGNVYYPGIRQRDEARPIDLIVGQDTEIIFKVP